MDSLVKDLLASYKRLNEELTERVEYEHKLIAIIESKDKEIAKLKEQIRSQDEDNILYKEYLKDIEDKNKPNPIEEFKTNGCL